jgi:hypothetical protein
VLDEDGFRELLANGPAVASAQTDVEAFDETDGGDNLEDHQEGSAE